MARPAWTLLPPNATALELALEDVARRRFEALGPAIDMIRALWDPWTCPAGRLDDLAWAYDVPMYSSGWPEERRRTAIAGAVALHRIEGTRGALEATLEHVGAQYNLVAHTGSNHHTATLTILNSNQILGRMDELLAGIERVKRLSVHLTVKSRQSLDVTPLALAQGVAFAVAVRADLRIG